MYDHKHYYFYINSNPWTLRLQGENYTGEIYIHPGKIDCEQEDVSWRTIKSPSETTTVNLGLPEHIINGITVWAEAGCAGLPLQRFLVGLQQPM